MPRDLGAQAVPGASLDLLELLGFLWLSLLQKPAIPTNPVFPNLQFLREKASDRKAGAWGDGGGEKRECQGITGNVRASQSWDFLWKAPSGMMRVGNKGRMQHSESGFSTPSMLPWEPSRAQKPG